MSQVIEDLGPSNILSVVMDGTTHTIDDYIKNICTRKEEIGDLHFRVEDLG